MNDAFIFGFVDELEKRAFLGKKELGAFQRKLKELQKHLAKRPQIETIPAEGGKTEEKQVRPGSAMESAKSMAGDVIQKVKGLKPLNRRMKK